MIAIDTNILARFYVDDPNDPEAAAQRPIARHLLGDPTGIFVPRTVVLELEWVLRAFYGFGVHDFARVVRHLLGLPNVQVEDWEQISDALAWHDEGLDFADALHLAAARHCERMASFDDRKFARRAGRMDAKPPVWVPSDQD